MPGSLIPEVTLGDDPTMIVTAPAGPVAAAGLPREVPA